MDKRNLSCPRLIDYLIVAGKNFVAADPKASAISTQIPELLRCYPPCNHEDFPLPLDVALFCQPNGCINITYEWLHAYESPTSFLFTLTDKDSNKVRYGICLNFFRPLKAAFTGSNALPAIHGCARTAVKTSTVDERSMPRSTHTLNSLCIISHYPFFTQFIKCLTVLKILFDEIQSRITPSEKCYIWDIISGAEKPPAVSSMEFMMLQSVEKWILRLLSTPAPVAGQTNISIKLLPDKGESVLTFALPDRFRLSLTDFPLHLPLELLGAEMCLAVLSCILLEKKIIFQSCDVHTLTTCVMSFITLLYPLQYMFPIIPLLPTCMALSEQLLLAPTPYVIGITSSFLPCKKHLFELPADVWIIDLDSSEVIASQDQGVLPDIPKETYQEMIFHFQKVLDLLEAQKPIRDLDAYIEKNQTLNRTDSRGTSSSHDSSNRSQILFGNDPDSVDIALRVCMVRFFNSPEILLDFSEYTRTLRLYPRAVVAFQTQNFLRSRKQSSEFTKCLVDTQAVEYLAEWCLLPDNHAYERITEGMFDPLIIGDKGKWFGAYLRQHSFTIFDRNLPLFANLTNLFDYKEPEKQCKRCYFHLQKHFVSSDLSGYPSCPPLSSYQVLVDLKEYYHPQKRLFLPRESDSCSQQMRVSPFIREGLRSSMVKGSRDSIRNRIYSVNSDNPDKAQLQVKRLSLERKNSSDWFQNLTSSFTANQSSDFGTKSFLMEIVNQVVKGKTAGIFSRNRFKNLMKKEACRSFVLHQLNGNLMCKPFESLLVTIDDIILPSRNVYHSMCWIMEVILQGVEHTVVNGTRGGVASTFMLLEILHTHFVYHLTSSNAHKKVEEALEPPNNPFASREEEGLMAAVGDTLRRVFPKAFNNVALAQGSAVTMDGEEYEAIDLIKLNSSANQVNVIDRRLSYSTYLVNSKPKLGSNSPSPLLLVDSRVLSTSDPSLGSEDLAQSFYSETVNFNNSELQSTWKRAKIPGECAKNHLNHGYRYISERLLSVRPPGPEEVRTYLFQHFNSSEESKDSRKHPLWDDMRFWEDLFLDIVAQEREIVGLEQHPREMMARYENLSSSSQSSPSKSQSFNGNNANDEKRKLEFEEDRLLASTLFNLIAFMLMMNVPTALIKSKGRRFIAKCHIGLYHSQIIHRLLDNLQQLRGNHIDLKAVPSRYMCRKSFAVCLQSNKAEDIYYLEVAEDSLILRNEMAIIKARWWFENIIQYTFCAKQSSVTLWWCHTGNKVESNKFYCVYGQELYSSIEESMKGRRSPTTVPMEPSTFAVQYPDDGNRNGQIEVRDNLITFSFAKIKCEVAVSDVKRCFAKNGNEIIVIRNDKVSGKSICHKMICNEAAALLSRLHQAMTMHAQQTIKENS